MSATRLHLLAFALLISLAAVASAQTPSIDLRFNDNTNATSRTMKLESGARPIKYALRVEPASAQCDMQIEQWPTGNERAKRVMLSYETSSIRTTAASQIDPSDMFYPPPGYTTAIRVRCSNGGTANVSTLTASR